MAMRLMATVVLGVMLASMAYGEENSRVYPINQVSQVSQNRQEIDLYTETIYPNGCYKPSILSTNVDFDKQQIELVHLVNLQGDMCIQALIPYYGKVSLPNLPDGSYQVIDYATRSKLGNLTVDDRGVSFESDVEKK